jgi:hypothetical protein
MGRMRPFVTVRDFCAWRPDMLSAAAGFGQEQTLAQTIRCNLRRSEVMMQDDDFRYAYCS